MGFIYILTSISGKKYVGQTIRTVEQRFKEHQRSDSGCRVLRNAIQLYGWEVFEKEYFEWVDNWDLDYIEMILVEQLETLSPNGYNLKEGGGNRKFSEETKQLMSINNKGENNPMFGRNGELSPMWGMIGELNPFWGREHTDETKEVLRLLQTGRKHTDVARERMSESRKGKPKSEKHKQALSESKMGDKHHNSKQVHQYELNGTYIRTFGSCGEAGRHLGKKHGDKISGCARGKYKKAYNFKWSYVML
jgi:group I intron endonuclease